MTATRQKRLRDAAFRIDNSVGSLIATIPFNQFEAVEGYNPFEDDNTLAGYEDMQMRLFTLNLRWKRPPLSSA